MELTTLIEDPENATVQHIVAEAVAKGRSGGGRAAATGNEARIGSIWISPSPVSIKMRIFCLPYAGGVSENVFARCAPEFKGRPPRTNPSLEEEVSLLVPRDGLLINNSCIFKICLLQENLCSA